MLGLIQDEIAKFFGVAERTFKYWLTQHPELRTAMTEGGAIADAEVAVSLYRRAIGYSHPEDDIRAVALGGNAGSEIVITPTIKHYPPDTMAGMYWLNNRRRGQWSRSPDPSGGEEDLPPTKVVFEVRDARSPNRQGRPEPSSG